MGIAPCPAGDPPSGTVEPPICGERGKHTGDDAEGVPAQSDSRAKRHVGYHTVCRDRGRQMETCDVIEFRPGDLNMSSIPPTIKLTPAEYLAIERKAEFKSEYYAGKMFAMAGMLSAQCDQGQFDLSDGNVT